MIDDKGYATLGAAVADAQDGDTIVMQEDVPDFGVGEDVTFTKNVTLDLGAKTLTFGAASTKTKFVIDAGAEVTIQNGSILIPAGFGAYAISVKGKLIADFNMRNATYGPLFDLYGTGEMVVNGGTYGGTGNSDIFRWKEDNATHKITINDGTFAACDYGTFYVYKSGDVADIAFNGGTFEGDVFHGNYADSLDFKTGELDDSCLAKFKTTNVTFNGTNVGLGKFCKAGYAPVLGNDGYYTIQQVFDITITKPENGTLETSVTNGVVAGTVVTVTATPATGFELESITTNGTAITGTTFEMPAEAVTVAATFKSAAPAWPEDWPGDADPAVVDKFADWQKANPGVTSFEGHEEQFLMNVAADAQVPELKIDSIAVEGNTATIVVSADGTNLKTVNGVLYVDGANDLTNWTTTEVDLAAAATFSEDGTTATFTVTSAKFMKAGVGFKAPVVEE